MAHNSLIRVAWNVLTDLHAAEMAAFDAAQFASINGDAGGTWAPASVITIGGAGIDVTGAFTTHGTLHAFGTATFDAALHATSTAAIDGSLTVGGITNLASLGATGSVVFSNTLSVTGAATVSGGLTVNVGIGISGTLGVSGTSSFIGLATLSGGAIFNCDTAFNGSIHQFNALTVLAGPVSLSAPMTGTGAGRHVPRVTFISTTGANSSAHGPQNADVVYVASLSADVTFTIDDTGAQDGDQMRFVNKSTTHLLTINDPSTGTFIALKTASGSSDSCVVMRIGGEYFTISQDRSP